jgi:hypothetical protein
MVSVYLSLLNDTVTVSCKCYDNYEYTRMLTYLWLVRPMTYCVYMKLNIVPNAICDVMCVINGNAVKFNF